MTRNRRAPQDAANAPPTGASGHAPHAPPFLGQAHLLLIISGPSNIGPGRTLLQESEVAAAAAPHLAGLTGEGGADAAGGGAAARSRAFYEQAAVAAASVGACVDVFAVAGVTVGLQVGRAGLALSCILSSRTGR
jgi:hypothetical protein